MTSELGVLATVIAALVAMLTKFMDAQSSHVKELQDDVEKREATIERLRDEVHERDLRIRELEHRLRMTGSDPHGQS